MSKETRDRHDQGCVADTEGVGLFAQLPYRVDETELQQRLANVGEWEGRHYPSAIIEQLGRVGPQLEKKLAVSHRPSE